MKARLIVAALFIACGSAKAQVEAGFFELVSVAEGLSSPLSVTHAPGEPDRVYLVEQCGTIRVLEDGTLLPGSFLDISSEVSCGGEQGLLGLAFHPDYQTNGFFYVDYTDNAGDTVVERYEVTGGVPGSPETVMTLTQPLSNHNGGHIAFGPDGYLYIALGDGGGSGDPDDHGQNTSDLLGTLLRLDVDSDDFPGDPDRNYGVPADNPFVGATGEDEIWAFGLRNPWRFSFDRDTGDLFIADVGQFNWEEINRQPAASTGGENYGWDVLEGTHCFEDDPGGDGSCDDFLTGGSVLPVHEYSHNSGDCSVTGGHVYRASSRAFLSGRYLYGDFCTGRIWTMNPDGSDNAELIDTSFSIAGFGEDEAGRLYVADLSGSAHRITPYTFADVTPDAFAWSFIETIVSGEITAGCSADPEPLYCPGNSITRAQMAVFLLRSAEGPGYEPPACVGVFDDVACPSPFADWIEELSARGITAGCGGGNYCPDDPVSRDQMAVFLLSGVEGSGYQPPACVGAFDDVPCPSPFADWIEELAARGVTAGCSDSPPLYCPGEAVNRAQMATFLAEAFGMAPATP